MFEKIIPLIEQIATDRTVPRNIRTKCEESVQILKNEKEAGLLKYSQLSGGGHLPINCRIITIWPI